MNYQQTVEYLFSRLPMFSRLGAAAYNKDLVNMVKLCSFLGDQHNRIKCLHVGGTNGKGSVSHMLAAILQTAGYKTGLYTSPHLKDFRERIRINGEMIREGSVIEFTSRIKPLIEEIAPSFFEITLAMAFDYFAAEKVDIAVIEVGLGGRFDSTNIIRPELAAITNIGLDHMNLLGDSWEKIAFEKAGIIKQGIPVVIGEVLPETLPVFETAAANMHAPLNIAEHVRFINNWSWEKNHLVVEVGEANKTDHQFFHLDLPGIYQRKNLLTVLEICSRLKKLGWNTGDEVARKALKQVKKLTGLHGRWEIIHQSPVVVIDVAHNIDGIRQLIQQVEVTEHNQLHIIFGMVNDKEVETIMAELPKTAEYYFTKAQIPRALPENDLARMGIKAGLKGTAFPEVNEALHAALDQAQADDLILVCGSVYLVGEVSTIGQ